MADTEPDSALLSLDGALTIRRIAAIRDAVRAALADNQTLQLDCSAADSVDLSFIQLLIAARESMRNAGGQLTLAAPPDGPLRAALEQGGFLPADGTDPFWLAAA